MTKFYQFFRANLTVLLMLGAMAVFAQQKTVTGKVTGSDGVSLPGVNILEKGTTNGTVSDADGTFKISVNENATLTFSFIGYKTQEIIVGSQTNINAVLATDVTSLSEVVVVGYGLQEKKDVTGSIVAVGTEDFNKGIVSSPQDLMIGKVAGVQITTTDGSPGSGATIRIRGTNSISGSADPLIVIDGFPIDNGSATAIPGVSNPLALINPADIETFTVLKDASATAIYGMRASNGVIIITTKKGKAGKPQISYTGNYSINTQAKFFDVMNATEFKATVAQQLALADPSGAPLTPAAVMQLGTANTNWQKQIYHTGKTQDHNLSVAGTYKTMPYRISYGYTDQQGILKTTQFVRNSVNANLTPTFLDGDLQVAATFKGSLTQSNFGNTGAIGSAINYDPTQPVYSGNSNWGGYYTWLGSTGNPNGIAPSNPVALINQTSNIGNVYRGIGNLKIDYRLRFFPAIKLTANGGFDYSTSTGYNNNPNNAAFTYTGGLGSLNNYTGQNRSRLLDLYASYNKTLGRSKFDVTAGYSFQSFEVYATNFVRNNPPEVGGVPPTIIYTTAQLNGEGKEVPYRQVPQLNYLLSFFGRANYSYDDKYLLTVSLRDDASSRFAPANRWVVFPAAAVGWRINKESFMEGAQFVSDLKVRGSYGITGNQALTGLYGSPQNPSYPYLGLYLQGQNTSQYQFGNGTSQPFQYVTSQSPQAYAANLKWEQTAQLDVGLDYGFFGNRITGTFDYYQKKTTNLLNSIPVPLGSNFTNTLFTNVGSMTNSGIEVGLRAVVVKSQDFEWNLGFNFAHQQNKITKLLQVSDPSYEGAPAGPGISGGLGGQIQDNQVGHPINSFFVFQQIYNQQGKPVEGLYTDVSGQGGVVSSNNANKIFYHSPQPSELMGISSRFTYKRFDFYFQGRVSLGNYVYNNNLSSRAYYQNIYYNQGGGFFNNMPIAIQNAPFVQPQYFSSYYVQNASFFKMDNMSLGYSVRQVFDTKLRGRLGFTVQNAFWITKYKGNDPEVLNGVDNNVYPRPRVYMLNLNLSF